MQFDRNTVRLGLGLIAAFYVIVGGLFIQAYIPVARFNSAIQATLEGRPSGYPEDEPYAFRRDTLNLESNESKVRRYGALLLWGTVGLVVFGGVVFVTRRKTTSDSPQ